MEKEPVNVKVLCVSLVKEGKKTILTFAIENDKATKNQKGYLVINQWIESDKPFKNISDDLIDVELEGVVEYKATYGANATLELIELYDEKGNNLLA